MRRTNRMLAAGALSVPMALGASGVAFAAGENHSAEAENRTQSQAEVQAERFSENGVDENQREGLLGLGLIKVDEDENAESDEGDNGDEGEEFLIDLTALS